MVNCIEGIIDLEGMMNSYRFVVKEKVGYENILTMVDLNVSVGMHIVMVMETIGMHQPFS